MVKIYPDFWSCLRCDQLADCAGSSKHDAWWLCLRCYKEYGGGAAIGRPPPHNPVLPNRNPRLRLYFETIGEVSSQ